MSAMNTSETYVGVGHTLLRLVEGLVKLRVVDPNDDPRPAEALDDAVAELNNVEAVEDLPLAALKLIRLSIAMGVRPTAGEVPEDVITAEVGPGLELLEAVKEDVDRNLTVRMIATAMSVLFDYAYTLLQPAMEHLADEEKEASVRAALLIAESSARAVGDWERAAAGVASLQALQSVLGQIVEEETNPPEESNGE